MEGLITSTAMNHHDQMILSVKKLESIYGELIAEMNRFDLIYSRLEKLMTEYDQIYGNLQLRLSLLTTEA